MPFKRPRGDWESPGCCMGEELRGVTERQPRHDSCLAAHFPDSRVILEILEVGNEKGQRRRAVVRHCLFPFHHQIFTNLLLICIPWALLTFGWFDYSSEARGQRATADMKCGARHVLVTCLTFPSLVTVRSIRSLRTMDEALARFHCP